MRAALNEQISMRKLIGVKEAAQYTGLSVYTVYTMVSQRRIPYVKVGRLVKFDVPMLDAWIKSNTVLPMPPKRA
jgi:excisionase family DNA binding protein